jgi:hypothetical protein
MTDPTPLRPDEQVAGAFLDVRLGGQEFVVTVLPISANRTWTAHLASEIRSKLETLEPIDSADQVAQLLAGQAETMMDLLIAYDAAGAKTLPERDWIDTHATDGEVYEAMKRVTAAAYPFGPDLLRIVPELVPMLMQSLTKGIASAAVSMASLRYTSSAPPSTDGPPTTSKPMSPTSSSRSTPRKPRSAASKLPLRS